MIGYVGSTILKRALEGGSPDPDFTFPPWAWIVFLLDLIVLLPLGLVLFYTFAQLYPVFAIIEDENPPAYAPVSLNDDGVSLAEGQPGVNPTDGQPTTVTSSVRAINRLLSAHGGFRANFRGFFCMLAQMAMTGFLMGVFTSTKLGQASSPVATLLAALSLIQFSTAWVHIVISQPSKLPFWRRLPPFKRTFEATWKAVVLYWLASELHRWVPTVMALILHVNIPDPTNVNNPADLPKPDSLWKFVVMLIPSLLSTVFIVIPAHVVLVRVQASLLPVDEDTIIPFDRSFEGLVNPAVVDGKGYATVSDAWKTFSRAGWRRLIVLYVKIFAITFAGCVLALLVVVPEIIVMAKPVDHSGDPKMF